MLSREEGSPPSLGWPLTLCVTQPTVPWAFFAVRVRCWRTFNSVSAGTLRSSSAKLLSSWLALNVQDLVFPFVGFHEDSVGLCLQPVQVPLNSSATVWCVHPLLPVPGHLQMCRGCALSPPAGSLMKMFKSVGPRINPWGLPLVTALQLDFVLISEPTRSASILSASLASTSTVCHNLAWFENTTISLNVL